MHGLGQPQWRGDIDIVGRNHADSHAHADSHPDANPHAAAKEAQEEGLEHFHLSCSVSGAKKEAFAVCDGNGLEGLFRCTQQLFVGPGSVAA